MNWKKGDKVYCIDEGNYAENITKRNSYIIEKIGEGTKEGKIRIKSNQDRFVWISDFHFVDYEIPSILFIQLDHKIKDIKNDCIDVTIIFSDGKKRWLTFTTPQYLDHLFFKTTL